MTRLALQFLGTFQATVNGQAATGFRSNRARALLAYLVTEAGRPYLRPRLAADFWPDLPEAEALHNLRQTLVRIRQAIQDEGANPPHLLVSRQEVSFNPASDHQVDLADFERSIAAANGASKRQGIQFLEKGVGLYRGEFLSGFSLPDSYAFDEWQLLKRERFQRQVLEALHTLAAWYLNQGDAPQALLYAQRQLEIDSWREEAHRQAMLALALSGQRSAALAQYETCRKLLAAELGTAPETETAALYEAIKAGEIAQARQVPVSSPLEPPHSNLPVQLTPFIGRQAELDHLLRLLKAPPYRLVTLAGEGGMGKTRLALALAERVEKEFADGVWFVSLAEAVGDITDPAQAEAALVTAIAAALGLAFYGKGPPRLQLFNFLGQRELLLVLDNFESLLEERSRALQTRAGRHPPYPVDPPWPPSTSPSPGDCQASAVDFVLALLQQAPRLKVLVTSRERLNLQAEYLYRLKGLPVPDPGDAAAPAFSSIQLFAERAERAWHEFHLDQAILEQAIRLCQLVDGLPLGIELAAARAGQMEVSAIVAAIQQDLNFLTSTQRDRQPRHRSLQAVFEGSWKALGVENQAILAQCALLAGSFDLPAAAAIANATCENIQGLLDRSLLRQAAPGRYEMHALVRQFAAQKWAGASPAARAQTGERYVAYYTRYLEQRLPHLHAASQKQALNEIGQEIENLRQIWHQAASTGLPHRLRLAEGLESFYELRGWYSEGLQLFTFALRAGEDAESTPTPQALSPTPVAPPLELAVFSLHQAHFYHLLGQFEAARSLLETCLSRVRQAGDPVLLGRCLHTLSCTAIDLGELAGGLAQAHEALALFEQAGAARWIAQALTNIGRALAVQGQYAAASEAYRRGLSIRRELGAPLGLADSLNNLGLLALRTGDYPAAERYLSEALAFHNEMENPPGMAAVLSNLGLTHLEQQRYPQARQCFQEALAIQKRIGDREAIGISHNNLGDVANLLGEYSTAIEHLQTSLAIKREMNNRRGQTFSLVHLGHAYFGLGNTGQAWHCHHEALAIAREISLTPLMLAALVGMAQVLASSGQPALALEWLQAPLSHPAGWQRIREEALALATRLQRCLAPAEVEAAQGRGNAASFDEVVAVALAKIPCP